jgi:nitroreductase
LKKEEGLENIKKRRVKYSDIELCADSALLAPSDSNSQPARFIIIEQKTMRNKIADICGNQKWMVQAPVHVVCLAELRARFSQANHFLLNEQSPDVALKKIIRDSAIAAEHFVLQAYELKYGPCWVSKFEQNEIRKLLKLPSYVYVIAGVTMGIPAEKPTERPRKELDVLLFWGECEDL